MKIYTKVKDQKSLFISFMIMIMIIFVNNIYFVEEYYKFKYPKKIISCNEIINSNEALKDFSNNETYLTSTSTDPWFNYNNDISKLNRVKTITINVEYLSGEVMDSQIYIGEGDSLNCINYKIKQGENIINVPEEVNDNNNLRVFRFDFVSQENATIKIDNIIFNDDNQQVIDEVKDNFNQRVNQLLCIIMIIIIPIILFKLGIKRIHLNKKGFWLGIISAIATIILYKYNLRNNVIFITILVTTYILMNLSLYSVLMNLIKLINKKKNIKIEIILLILYSISFIGIFYNMKIISIGLLLYYFYFMGYIYDDVKFASENKFFSKMVTIISLLLSTMYIFKFNNYFMIIEKSDASESKLLIMVLAFFVWIIGFNFLSNNKIKKYISNTNFTLACRIVMILLINTVSQVLDVNINIVIYLCLICFIFFYFNFTSILNLGAIKKEFDIEYKFNKYLNAVFVNLIIASFILILFESLVFFYFYDKNILSTLNNIYQYIFTAKYLYNVIFLIMIIYTLKSLLGKKLGSIILLLICTILFVGNFIKLKYQDSLLKPADFYQMKTLVLIADKYVNVYIIIMLSIILILFFVFTIRYCNIIKSFFKPKPRLLLSSILIIITMIFIGSLEVGKFADVNIYNGTEWKGDKIRIDYQGFIIYNYFNLKSINDIRVQKPEKYNKETMMAIYDECKEISIGNISNIKPDVILVMNESMFDVEKIPQLEFSKTLDSNINKYQKSNIISPRYGGGTASVEFEALTGFSNLFFEDNIVQYVTYWNGEDDIPSIAREFKKNGYKTAAFHPNDVEVYNRYKIYKQMGFDNFGGYNDFKNNNAANARGYVLDSEMKNIIERKLNETEEPQFIFGITIENHSPYNVKSPDSDIEILSDKLSTKELNELEVYSEGVENADKFIGQLVEMVNSRQRPTILYLWGDHLPSLEALDTLGFNKDITNKYSTPIIAYSNFKDIEINNQYITPNQIATQILKDSGIDYSKYFDYIYSLRNGYPIIHKEFGTDTNDENIKKYQLIQYDLLFGNQYMNHIK